MKISFVIPAYNEEVLIGRCIQSIQSALASGSYNAEIIVVDNGSYDRTKDIASGHSDVRVVHEPRKGLTRARQRGFASSTGDLIANIDADTILHKRWLTIVMSEFARDENLVALSGPFIYYELSTWQLAIIQLFYLFGYVFYLINKNILRTGSMLQGGNFILRRSALQKIGGFDTSIEFYGEDTDMARRIGKVGKVKWTFRLPIFASARRLEKEGMLTMGWRYALNYFWTTYRGKPFTKKYIDVRP
jgi:cellulose synthase/poly-beta-1,6-N-acetylglucosamine synthase-like glycosyltransferase